jgi:Transketolase
LTIFFFLVDWNNYGIDDHPVSETVYGTPKEWFGCHGWRVIGTDNGSDFKEVFKTEAELFDESRIEPNVPNAAYFKTRKGRGYLKYDNASHGAPHKMNSELFWETKKEFQDKIRREVRRFWRASTKNAGRNIQAVQGQHRSCNECCL